MAESGNSGITEKQGALQVKKRTVDLLPDAENNIAKLEVTRFMTYSLALLDNQ